MATTSPSSELEHAANRALGPYTDVFFDLDRVSAVAQREGRLLERDHLHVLAELTGLVELLLGQLDHQPIGEATLGDHQKFLGVALSRVVDHPARGENGVGQLEHVASALRVSNHADVRHRFADAPDLLWADLVMDVTVAVP